MNMGNLTNLSSLHANIGGTVNGASTVHVALRSGSGGVGGLSGRVLPGGGRGAREGLAWDPHAGAGDANTDVNTDADTNEAGGRVGHAAITLGAGGGVVQVSSPAGARIVGPGTQAVATPGGSRANVNGDGEGLGGMLDRHHHSMLTSAHAMHSVGTGDGYGGGPFIGSGGQEGAAGAGAGAGGYVMISANGTGKLKGGVATAATAAAAAAAQHTPTSHEVLERVRDRTPLSTEGWAMITAAAAAAMSDAVAKQGRAVAARQQGKQLAALATRAVGRARKAAMAAAAIRSGETRPVPHASVPASVLRRLALGKKRRKNNKGDVAAAGSDANGVAVGAAADTNGTKPDHADIIGERADERHKHRKGGKNGRHERSNTLDGGGHGGGGGGDDCRQGKAPVKAEPEPARPPRPTMDIVNDPKAAARAEMWQSAAALDSCHVCGEEAPDYWNREGEIVYCDGCEP